MFDRIGIVGCGLIGGSFALAVHRHYPNIEIHGVDFIFEKKIQGSNMGSNQFRTDMPRLVDMYLDGRLMLDEMVSARISLEEVNQGFEAMKSGSVTRSVITFD